MADRPMGSFEYKGPSPRAVGILILLIIAIIVLWGTFVIIPGVDKLLRISLRTVALEIPPHDVITRDNISIKVNGVVYFRVIDPNKAVVGIENYLYATSQLVQTTLRSIIGQSQLDELLSERDKINAQLQDMLDKHTEPWGIKVSLVETKQVDLDTEMQRAIARQAEAERERRAKVIHAEGEAQAAEKLAEAANIISVHPAAMHLRFLQTLTEVIPISKALTSFSASLRASKLFISWAPLYISL
ncbi:MAG: slipin family protein [Deltaproteobacteria bacterium]